MKTNARRIVSLIAAMTLLLTCAISGLVLPAAATGEAVENLVPNGDFEQGAVAPWTGTNDYVTVKDGVGFGGTKGLELGAHTDAVEIYWKSFKPTLEPNSVYLVTYMAKGPEIRLTSNSVTDIVMDTSYAKPVEGEWVTAYGFLKTGNAPKFDSNWGIYFRRDGAATEATYVDNVSIVKFTDETNHFVGSDFNAIGRDHWSNHLNAGATVVTEADGNKALQIPADLTGDKWVRNPYLTPGVEYTVSFKAKGAPVNFFIYGGPSANPYATGGDTGVWNTTEQTSSYKTYTYTFTAGTGITDTDDYLLNLTRNTAATKTGEVTYIDDFKLIETPEPKFEMAGGDFEAEHGWTYNSTVTGQFAKGDSVPTQTDADGNKYIVVPANGSQIRSPEVKYQLEKGDWIRIEFKLRKNTAGKATIAMQLQGKMFDGYAQPEWTISTSTSGTSGNGEWFTYVTYAQASQATNNFYVIPFLLSNKTTADLTLDMDDFKIEVLPKGSTKYDFELLDTKGFEEGNISTLNDYGFGGLFNDGGKIVADPADSKNHALYFDGTAAKVQAYFYPVNYTYVPAGTTSKTNTRMEKKAVYKLTYRQKGSGTTTPGMTPTYGSIITTTGEPGVASDEWKDITVYYMTGSSVNANYGWDFIVSGEVYLDDMSLTLVEPATSLELDKATAKLTVGETLTLTVAAKPEGSYAADTVFTSSNDAVATVVDGVVTAVSAGTATITVTSGTLSATCVVTVEEPAAVDPSIVVSDDFENGPQGVFAGATDTSTSWNVVDGGVNGGKALAITYKNGDRWFKWNNLTFEANTRYSITFLAKGPQVRLGVYKYIGSVDVKGGSFNLYTNPYQDDWTSYRLEFTTGANGFGNDPANSNYGMFFNRPTALADTTAVTLIDNFKIQKTDETTDRVIGGDFTYPGMQQWKTKHFENSKGGFVVVTDPDDATNKVLKVNASTASLGDAFLQGLYLEGNRTYVISFKAKGAPINLRIPAKQLTSDSAFPADTWVYTDETTEWKTYTYEFTTTSGAAAYAEAQWILNVTRAAAGGDTYVDDFSITMKEIPNATGITMNKEETSVGIGATDTLTITTTPAGAKYDSLSWKSSDESVVTVVDGVVTGVATGTATITATVMVGDQALTATCTVKVVVKATSFEILQDSLHLAPQTNSNRLWVYETLELKTEPADADTSDLVWTSSDENVVTVDANGTVKALSAGTATVTVSNGTVSDTIVVTVSAMGERVTGGDFEDDDYKLVCWTSSIIKDGAGTLVKDPTNPDNTVLMIPGERQALWMWQAHVDKGVTYKLTMKVMSAGGVAMMHFTPGHVEGNSDSGWASKTIATEGWTEVTYIIRPSATNFNRNYTIGFGTNTEKNPMFVDDVSLVQLPEATGIALEDTQIGVKGSKTLAITATPAESNVPVLTWESSDPSIISVDQAGKITAVAGEGSVTITAKSADGALTASCTVSIAGDYATEIKLNLNSYYAKKDTTMQLTVSTTPADGLYKKLVWTSSDETIATVDQNGLVTIGNKEGETTITVTSGELTASCKVVVPGAAQSFELKEEAVKLAPPRGSKKIAKTLTVVTTPKNSDAGDLVWTSSNEAVATVDANGKVTALAEGEATITVKNADGSISDTCVVTVAWDGERLTGGTFEHDDWTDALWGSIIRDGRGYVTTDPSDLDNMVLAFPKNDDALSALWMSNIPVNAGKTYKISFKVKGDGVDTTAQLASYFHATSCNLNGWKYVSNLTGEWTEVSYIFTAASLDDGTSGALNRNYLYGIDNVKTGIVYIDDYSLIELPDATAIMIGNTEELKIRPEGTASLNLRTEPAEASAGKLTWSSSDDTIIAVDQNGKVTVVGGAGSVTITVTSDKGLSDTITVTIDDYAELLENGDFEMGDTYWASHSVIKPGIGKDGSYGMMLNNGSSKQDNFYKGTLPLQPSTTYIVEWDYYATVDSEFRLWTGSGMGLALSASTQKLNEWQHGSKVFTTSATMGDLNSAATKGWVFSVTSDKGGTADKAIVDNISIKLYASGVEAESIKLNKSKLTMMPGRTDNLAIMATPVDGDINRAKWTSSDENVVTVEYGIVTAVGKGTATVTATTYDGRLSASCEVTVAGEPAFITNGTFDGANDGAWTFSGDAAITEKTGVQNTASGTLTTNETSILSQKVTNLLPETTYQIFVRYRAASAGKLGISLKTDGGVELFAKTIDTTTSWTKATYEFTTPADLDDDATLSFTKISGGTIYLDNIFLSQKASMIDLVVENIIWDGGNEQVTPGTELTFFIIIGNKGEDPVKVGSVIDTDICVDGTPIQTISYLVTSELGTGATVLIAGDTPWAAVEGDHVISARVNSTMSVLEIDPTNNNRVQVDLRVNDVILEVPEIAQQAGFETLGFSDDFNNIGLIDSGDTRTDGYKWYVSRPYGTPSVKPDGYFIEDGVLTLVDDHPTYNMSLTTAEYNSGIGFSFNQGYMEVRIRIPRPRANQAGEDGIPAIWSLPIDKLQGHEDANWVEADWLEYWGINGFGSSRPEGYYTITFHDQDAANSENPYYNKNSNSSKSGLGDGEWHTMAWLWAQNVVVGYVDGAEVFRLKYSPDGFSDPMASVVSPGDKSGIGAFSYMNEQWLPVHISGSKDNPMEMDYIRIWTGNGGGFVGGDDEEEDDVVIDMAAEDFWYNYCTDDWGDPIAEVTEDNYLNVLGYNWETGEFDAEYVWTHLTDERRAEINELLESLGQPSYDEMLADALIILEGGDPSDDNSPDTGEHSAMPALAATALLLSAAVLWTSRKRRKNKA